MGFKSNLSSGEIVEQLVHASTFAHIRNVVFMVIAPLLYLFLILIFLCTSIYDILFNTIVCHFVYVVFS
jgi:hypothetical protein